MDADRLELIRRLFVVAAGFAEKAHDAAMAGQARSMSLTNRRASALQVHAAAVDLAAMATTLLAVVAPIPTNQVGGRAPKTVRHRERSRR